MLWELLKYFLFAHTFNNSAKVEGIISKQPNIEEDKSRETPKN